MSCRGCGGAKSLTKENVENLIAELVENGKLQAGLQGCDSNAVLPKNARVLQCRELREKVNQLIADKKLDFPKVTALTYTQDPRLLELTFGDETFSVTLPKHRARIEVRNAFGDETLGFIHREEEVQND